MCLKKEEMALLNNIANMILVTDLNGKIIFTNQALCSKLKVKCSDVKGRNIFEFVIMEHEEKAKKSLGLFLENENEKFDEFSIITPSGEKRTIEIISKKRKSEIFHSLKDVTDLKKNQDDLEQNRKLIKLINRMLRHDLLNDLVVILSALNIFEGGDKSMLVEARNRIKKAVDFIAQMRSLELLTMSKNNLRLFNLKNIFDNVRMHYPDIAINLNGNSQVIADQTLHSIFTNIFNNAVHHGHANSITIDIENHKDEIHTLVKISNNGDMIDKDILKDIFKHGVKSENTGNTGIGLYIVKENMLRYGGNISVKSNEKGNICLELRFKSI